ncbi:MAG: hypothetical protein WB538_21215 [Candidatus Sulfotelmatobacter sp.]
MLIFSRSTRLSSELVFRGLVDVGITAADDLWFDGIADFGVSGLVAACRGSELDLAEEERT